MIGRVNKNTTSSFLNLKLHNVYFWQTTTALINRVDKKKRDWQGSFMHEEARGREGCDTQAFLSNARKHTRTNVLVTQFSVTILFAFICHGVKNTCRDDGRGTVYSSRTAEHAWTPCFCLTPVANVTLLHYEWRQQRSGPWGIDRLTWRSDSLDDITSHRVPWVFSASICISKAFCHPYIQHFPAPLTHPLFAVPFHRYYPAHSIIVLRPRPLLYSCYSFMFTP